MRLKTVVLILLLLVTISGVMRAEEVVHSFVAAGNRYCPLSSPSEKEDSDVALCAPKVKGIKVIEHKDHPVPSPPLGKAMVCVIRLGGAIPLKPPAISVSANNKWVGEVRKNSYFCFESDPGLITLCAKIQGVRGAGTNHDILALTTQSEHIHYVGCGWNVVGPKPTLQQFEQLSEADSMQSVNNRKTKPTPLTSLKFLTFQQGR